MTATATASADPAGVLVIHNPAAGTRASLAARRACEAMAGKMHLQFVATEGPGHATEIARGASAKGLGTVVAMGGDGTVNEVARGLVGTAAALAIVPSGSGNGLARHLRISLDPLEALKAVASASRRRIDVGRINGRLFLCTAGIGFDAHVSRHFASSRRRGLIGYTSTCLRRYIHYRPSVIDARFGGQQVEGDCYFMTFANASQYGNDARIAPHADLADGVLDLCMVDRLPVGRAIRLARGMLNGDLRDSGAVTFHTADTVRVQTQTPVEFHADGEFIGTDTSFDVALEPLALEIAI